jgi:hypothetical protein
MAATYRHSVSTERVSTSPRQRVRPPGESVGERHWKRNLHRRDANE